MFKWNKYNSKLKLAIFFTSSILILTGCSDSNINTTGNKPSDTSKKSVTNVSSEVIEKFQKEISDLRVFSSGSDIYFSMKPKKTCLDNYKDSNEILFWFELIYNSSRKDANLTAFATRSTDVLKSDYGADLVYLDPPGALNVINAIDGNKTIYLEGYEKNNPEPCLEVSGSNRKNLYVSSQGVINQEQAAILRRTLAALDAQITFTYGTQYLESAQINDYERKQMLTLLSLFSAITTDGFDPELLNLNN